MPPCWPQGCSCGFAGLSDYTGLDVCPAAEEAPGETASWTHPFALRRELPAAEHQADVQLLHEGVPRQRDGWDGIGVVACPVWLGLCVWELTMLDQSHRKGKGSFKDSVSGSWPGKTTSWDVQLLDRQNL